MISGWPIPRSIRSPSRYAKKSNAWPRLQRSASCTGGVLYYLEDSFCGIFSYKNHITLEFSKGYQFEDEAGVLEGSGKFRRHIKFKHLSDIRDKRPAVYLEQAIALAKK